MMSKHVGKLSRTWWQGFAYHDTDRSSLALLRRGKTLLNVAAVPATRDLLTAFGGKRDLYERAAVIAHVLAFIQTDDHDKVATVIGAGEQPILSYLRLNRLIRADTLLECMAQFRTLVTLVQAKHGSVNVADIAQSIFEWTDPETSEQAKLHWLFHYSGGS